MEQPIHTKLLEVKEAFKRTSSLSENFELLVQRYSSKSTTKHPISKSRWEVVLRLLKQDHHEQYKVRTTF